MKKRGIKGPVAQTLLYLILAVTVLLVLAPIVISFMYSLKQPYEHMLSIWKLPDKLMWEYYIEAFNSIYRYGLNSLLVCIATTLGVIFFSSMTAYVFARHDFLGKNIVFSLIMALMMVPSVMTMTCSFLNVMNLGLLNSLWALILPGIAGGQVGAIFLFRVFISQLPKSLYESATIDGANDLVLYSKITLPLIVPVLIIQGLGTFSLMYNDYLWPTLVLRSEETQTLMMRLKYVASEVNVMRPGVSYAMYLLSGIPLVFASLIGLRYFINGDYASGMKL